MDFLKIYTVDHIYLFINQLVDLIFNLSHLHQMNITSPNINSAVPQVI